MRKSSLCQPDRTHTMDAERTNAIGTQLTDLAARTQELRGYL